MALINLRNALMAGRRLPYDAEVEYLESTGTQWIDTGLFCDQDTDIVFSGRTRTVTTAAMFFFGARTAFQRNAFTACLVWNAGQNQMLTQVGFGSFDGQNYLPNIPSNSDFIISNRGTAWSLTVGGQTTQAVATTSAFTTPATALLFRMSNNGTADSRSFNGAIYSAKLYQNGVLVRDYIPVRKGSVGYLYDRVSGKLFGNAGSGDFVLGPDVVPVEYIESTGTQWIATGLEAGRTSSSIKIGATLRFTDVSTGEHDIAGSGNAATPTMGRNGSNYFMWAKGGTAWYPTGCDTNWHTVSYTFNNPSGRVFELDGVSYSGSQDNTFATGDGIHVFASGPNRYPLNCQLTKLEIWQNGVLVRNYISVRVGNEGALLDTVNHKIYRNVGTGAFLYGNDV